MFKLIIILLLPSVLWAQDPEQTSIKNILKKYKTIREEIVDRTAIVRTTDAIVFADVGLNYPVHNLKKGEVLKLANFEVKLENVFPVLINGGVGYVRAGDINVQKIFSNQAASRLDQHNVDFMYEESISRLDGRTNFVFKYANFNAGTNWADFSDLAGDTAGGIKGYQFLIEFHPRNEWFGFGIGPSLYTAEQESIKLSTWAFEGQFFYSPAKWRLFQWDINFGVGFSSGLKISIQSIEGTNTGYFYSWNIGSSIRIFPDYKLGGILGFNYKTWSISGMKEVVFQDGTLADLNGFSGSDFYLGMTYKF